jgi:hypothetical protein
MGDCYEDRVKEEGGGGGTGLCIGDGELTAVVR